MQERLSEIQNQAKDDLAKADSPEEVEKIKTKYLGRKGGIISEIIKAIPGLPPEQRSSTGKSANILKKEISKSVTTKIESLSISAKLSDAGVKIFDVSQPGEHKPYGRKHPLTQTI
ncbi:MAG: hypothetical protein ACYSR7_00295, partial [Planctomycetota bacterium]